MIGATSLEPEARTTLSGRTDASLGAATVWTGATADSDAEGTGVPDPLLSAVTTIPAVVAVIRTSTVAATETIPRRVPTKPVNARLFVRRAAWAACAGSTEVTGTGAAFPARGTLIVGGMLGDGRTPPGQLLEIGGTDRTGGTDGGSICEPGGTLNASGTLNAGGAMITVWSGGAVWCAPCAAMSAAPRATSPGEPTSCRPMPGNASVRTRPTRGIRLEPPSRSNIDRSADVAGTERSARSNTRTVSSTIGRIRASNSSRVNRTDSGMASRPAWGRPSDDRSTGISTTSSSERISFAWAHSYRNRRRAVAVAGFVSSRPDAVSPNVRRT